MLDTRHHASRWVDKDIVLVILCHIHKKSPCEWLYESQYQQQCFIVWKSRTCPIRFVFSSSIKKLLRQLSNSCIQLSVLAIKFITTLSCVEATKKRVFLIDIANLADHHRNEGNFNPKEIRFVTECINKICASYHSLNAKKVFTRLSI